jgi:hypothetical protein
MREDFRGNTRTWHKCPLNQHTLLGFSCYLLNHLIFALLDGLLAGIYCYLFFKPFGFILSGWFISTLGDWSLLLKWITNYWLENMRLQYVVCSYWLPGLFDPRTDSLYSYGLPFFLSCKFLCLSSCIKFLICWMLIFKCYFEFCTCMCVCFCLGTKSKTFEWIIRLLFYS